MKKPSSNFEKSKDPATSDDDESSEDETSSEEESSEEEDSSEEDSEYEYDDRAPSDVANAPNISCGLLATAVSALSDYSHDFGIYEAEKSSQTTRSGRIVKSTRGQSRFHTRDHPWF